MKKIIFVLFVILSFVSCKEKKIAAEKTENQSSEKNETEEVLDFDLTTMGANMVYAQVFNMMIEPDSFKDKIFKMKGNFAEFTNSEGQKIYAVIIADALECCQQGIEFKYDFGGNLPEKNAVINVTGRYVVTELENGAVYCYVKAFEVN